MRLGGESFGADAQRYLQRAEVVLAGLPAHAREEVLCELRDHLVRWCDDRGRLPEDLSYAEIEDELGPAEALEPWGTVAAGAEAAVRTPGRRGPWAAVAAAVPVGAVVGILAYVAAGYVAPHAGAVVRSGATAPAQAAMSAAGRPGQAAQSAGAPHAGALTAAGAAVRAAAAARSAPAASGKAAVAGMASGTSPGLSHATPQTLEAQISRDVAELVQIDAQETQLTQRIAALTGEPAVTRQSPQNLAARTAMAAEMRALSVQQRALMGAVERAHAQLLCAGGRLEGVIVGVAPGLAPGASLRVPAPTGPICVVSVATRPSS